MLKTDTAATASPYAPIRTASDLVRTGGQHWSKTALAAETRARTGCTFRAAHDAAETVLRVRDGRAKVRKGRVRPAAPLLDRLAEFRRGKAARAWHATDYREPSCGDELQITFGAPAPFVARNTEEGWIDYKSRGYKRGIVACRTHLALPAGWTQTVHARGLATVDGLFTLGADPIESAPDGVELYAARWIRQGAGTSLRIENGVLARHIASGVTFHGSTTRGAVSGLTRKLRAQAIPPAERDARRRAAAERRAERQRQQLAELYDRIVRAAEPLGDLASVRVTLADSTRAGNCRPGTEEFRDRYFPGRDDVNLEEIAQLARSSPGMLASGMTRQVAAACLVAIRRERREAGTRRPRVAVAV